jgi:hypothetical protein
MKRPPKPRIIGCELLPDEEGPIVREARRTFLYAAAEHPAIRLADELRSEVCEKVKALPQRYWEKPFSEASIRHRKELNEAMWNWAKSFHLVSGEALPGNCVVRPIVDGNAEVEVPRLIRQRLGIAASARVTAGPALEVPWPIQKAWDAINTWAMHADLANPFIWLEVYLMPPSFELPTWFPQQERSDRYAARVGATFRNVLEKYVAEANTRYRAHNPPVTRNTARTPVEARYTWTALNVCRRWTYQRIADDHNRGRAGPLLLPQSIGVQVRAVRETIRLPLQDEN